MSTISLDHPVVTSLNAVKEQRLDIQLRQLEFHALLHRKLDLELLFESFLSEAQAFVRFDGLHYFHRDRGHDVLLGETRQHRQQFELRLGESSLGEVVLMRAKPFNSREKRDSERLVESLVYPLDNALEHHCLLLKSMTDAVSGVHNQLALDQQLPREMRTARRAQQPLAAMLLSIDYLETLSAEQGATAGSRAWHAVADAIGSRLRQSDMIFRTELDEFFVLLSQTDLEGALAISERLRQQVDLAVKIDNVQFVLSASAGLTELDESDDSESFVARARSALRLAEQAGRNKIRAVPAPAPAGGDGTSGPGSVA